MPPLDDRYVRNLQDFNKALGNIVIAIGLSMIFIAGAFVIISAATEGMTIGDASLTSGLIIRQPQVD